MKVSVNDWEMYWCGYIFAISAYKVWAVWAGWGWVSNKWEIEIVDEI